MFKSISNLKKYVLGLATIGMLAFGGGIAMSAVTPGSIQYTGEDTAPLDAPGFNAYTGVPSVGNEADFVRVKEAGEANSAYRNTIDKICEDGDVFNVWMYVHNGAGADGNNNGSGPSVAKDVTARVDLDNDAPMSSFDLTGFISSSNAGNLSDGAVIDCGDKKYELSYVANSAKAFLDLPNQTVNVPSAIVGNGTPIGTNALDGNVWGCWDQRVWLGLDVVVKEIEEEPEVAFSCDLLEVIKLSDRSFKFTVKASATNTEITDYKFSVKGGGEFDLNQQDNVAVLTVEEPGDYTVRAQVVTADGTTAYNDACTKKVTAEEEPSVPTYSCDLLQYKHISGRKYRFTTTASASGGAKVKHYTYNFAGETVVTDKSVYDYEFDGDGNKDVSVEVAFDVNDTTQTKTNEDCAVTVKVVKDQPEKLPETGAGAIAGLFTAVTAAGTLSHRFVTGRKQQ